MTEQRLPASPTPSQRWNAWVRVRPTWFHRTAHSLLMTQCGLLIGYALLAWTGWKTLDDALALLGAMTAVTLIAYATAFVVCEVQFRREGKAGVNAGGAA